MKTGKKALASVLSAALLLSGASGMLSGGGNGPSLLSSMGLGPDTAYADEQTTANWWDEATKIVNNSQRRNHVYANGLTVIIQKGTGDDSSRTFMYHDANLNGVVDDTESKEGYYVDVTGKVVYAGSNTGNSTDYSKENPSTVKDPAEMGSITMLSGNVSGLIGSNDGPGTMESSVINVDGGTVGAISIHETSEKGNVDRWFNTRNEFSVNNGTVNITGGTVTKYVRAAFEYAHVGEANINISGDAHIEKDSNGDSIYAGSNGEVETINITIDGGTIDGRISSGLRTLVGNYTLNFNAGTVKNGIFAGASYPDGETYNGSNHWPEWGWGYVNYGVTTGDTVINIGENADYRGIYAGFQFFTEDAKQFIKVHSSSSGNRNFAAIKEAYGINDIAAKESVGTFVLNVAKAPSAKPVDSGNYDDTVSLLDSPRNGVTVTSAGIDLTVSHAKVALQKASSSDAPKDEIEEVVEATLKLAAPAAANGAVINWKSSDESVATVELDPEDSRKATIKAQDVGACIVTASYTYEDQTVDAKVQVNVGGDFTISVSPAKIRLGDKVTFTAGRIPASSSNAPRREYSWETDRAVELSEDSEQGKSITGTAVAVGDGIVSLDYRDEDNMSYGSAAFTVEAPTVELDAPEGTVSVGDEISLEAVAGNINSAAKDEVETEVYCDFDDYEFLEDLGDGKYFVMDTPRKPIAFSAAVYYPTVDGEGVTYSEVTMIYVRSDNSLSREFLLTSEEPEMTVTLPQKLRRFVESDYVELEYSDRFINVDETELYNGKLTVAMADGVDTAGTASIRFMLKGSGSRLCAYNFNLEPGNSSVLEAGVKFVPPELENVQTTTPKAPEGVDEESFNSSVQDAVQKAIDSLGMNDAVYEDEALSGLGKAVDSNGLVADEETVSVHLEQELKAMEHEAIVEKDEEGNVTSVKIRPSKLTYEVDAFKTVIDENGEYREPEKLDLSKDKISRRTYFSFRIPVPTTVEHKYVNVLQDGERLGQYTISEAKDEEGYSLGKYITVRVWHLSTFELTFTNTKESSGRPSPEGPGSGGSSIIGKGVSTGYGSLSNGAWESNEALQWRYHYTNGSYASNGWFYLEWNGSINWYHFNAEGYVDSGWFTDTDGNTYYLHPLHDGNFGYMYTGWNTIDGKNYYFSMDSASGILKGALLKNTVTPDGRAVGADGALIG